MKTSYTTQGYIYKNITKLKLTVLLKIFCVYVCSIACLFKLNFMFLISHLKNNFPNISKSCDNIHDYSSI